MVIKFKDRQIFWQLDKLDIICVAAEVHIGRLKDMKTFQRNIALRSYQFKGWPQPVLFVISIDWWKVLISDSLISLLCVQRYNTRIFGLNDVMSCVELMPCVVWWCYPLGKMEFYWTVYDLVPQCLTTKYANTMHSDLPQLSMEFCGFYNYLQEISNTRLRLMP